MSRRLPLIGAVSPTHPRSASASAEPSDRSAAKPSDASTAGYYTPLVSKLAASLGVDLAQVKGNGVGGRITAQDVRAAAGVSRPPTRTAAVAAAQGSRAGARSLKLTFESQFVVYDSMGAGYGGIRTQRTVTVDVFGANPLADEARQAAPENYAAARRASGQEAPTLFTSGDLPLFTTAGFDPADLMALPWVARHAAARADGPRAAQIFDRHAETTEQSYWTAQMAFGNDDGPIGYRKRFDAWLAAGAQAVRGGNAR